ncbi:MAG: hypothetical protein CFE45_02445 [Burkholderiales bacterium PBB5]|nr:MAG: hypothetical protein CFE45_02445 [Burkholderiales bacterium PBB5]
MTSRIAHAAALCLALLQVGTATATKADDSLKPAPAASAPRTTAPPAPTARGKAVPKRESAVDAADHAQEPGRLRPEQAVVPQIVVPLRAHTAPAPARAGAKATGGEIDQDAARCAAQTTAAERERCKAGR